MRIEPWSEVHAREVETWTYEPPYDFYDSASDPDDAAEMRDPAKSHHFRALVGDDGELEAFWWLDAREDEGAVEVGLGLRPDLTGRGLGEAFIRAELDYVRAEWRPATFRLFVTVWNERAIRLYERLGFREIGRESRSFPLHGEHEFLKMERPA
jgi:RimJ/RimL family protein N-acetyltransferase